MGHYCNIKFSAKLTEIGVEIVEYLQEHSVLEAVEFFTQYPFIEAAYNRHKLDYLPTSGFDKINKILLVNWEHKIRNYRISFSFLLPYLISEEVEFIYADEYGDWKEYKKIILPEEPIIDWDRRFGDPTGIEL